MKSRSSQPSLVLALLFIGLCSTVAPPPLQADPHPDDRLLPGDAKAAMAAYQKAKADALDDMAYEAENADENSLDHVRKYADTALAALDHVYNTALKAGAPDPALVEWRRNEAKCWNNIREDGALIIEKCYLARAASVRMELAVLEVRKRFGTVEQRTKEAAKIEDQIQKGKEKLDALTKKPVVDGPSQFIGELGEFTGWLDKFSRSYDVIQSLRTCLDKDVRKTVTYASQIKEELKTALSRVKDAEIDVDSSGDFSEREKELKKTYEAHYQELIRTTGLYDAELRVLYQRLGGLAGSAGLTFASIPLASGDDVVALFQSGRFDRLMVTYKEKGWAYYNTIIGATQDKYRRAYEKQRLETDKLEKEQTIAFKEARDRAGKLISKIEKKRNEEVLKLDKKVRDNLKLNADYAPEGDDEERARLQREAATEIRAVEEALQNELVEIARDYDKKQEEVQQALENLVDQQKALPK